MAPGIGTKTIVASVLSCCCRGLRRRTQIVYITIPPLRDIFIWVKLLAWEE